MFKSHDFFINLDKKKIDVINNNKNSSVKIKLRQLKI